MKKENVFKFFNLFSKKDKEQNSMEILDFKIIKYLEHQLYGWKLPICQMSFIDKKGRKWIASSTFSEIYMSLDITIDGLSSNLTHIYGNIDNIDSENFEFFFNRIDVDEKFENSGIGKALQEMMLRILFLVAKENNITFKRIHGVIGINGKDKPEYSMQLYKSFDKHEYNGYKVSLNYNGFNTTDCNLEYFIE